MRQVGIENCSEKVERVVIAYNVWISPLIYDAQRHAREMLEAGLNKFKTTEQYRFLQEHSIMEPSIECIENKHTRNRYGDIEYRISATFYISDREYVAYILQYK